MIRTFVNPFCFINYNEHQKYYSEIQNSINWDHNRSAWWFSVLALYRLHKRYLRHKICVVLEYFVGLSSWLPFR
jgi:hypothetical protein